MSIRKEFYRFLCLPRLKPLHGDLIKRRWTAENKRTLRLRTIYELNLCNCTYFHWVAQYQPDTFTDNPHPSRNWKLVGDNFVSAFKNTQVLFRLVLACKIQTKKEKSLLAFGKWELPWRELRATIPSLIADSNWKVYYFLASSYRTERCNLKRLWELE